MRNQNPGLLSSKFAAGKESIFRSGKMRKVRYGRAVAKQADAVIDISLPAERVDAFDGGVVKRVQQSAQIELADFFTFVIGETQLDLNAAPQGGARYPVVASIAGRVFTKFHLDVGIGDAVVHPKE